MENTTNKVVNSLFWRFMERCGAQAVTFVVSLILARLLDPSAYGIVAIVTVFTTILQVFVDGGMGNALVQKKDADDLDFSTIFYFNLVICSVLYVLIFLLAPLIAIFYEKPELTALIRVASVIILISSIKNIQHAYVSRHLLFKKFFFSTLIGTILAAVAGIAMAFHGFGPWALITQLIINTATDSLVLFFTVKWRPKAMFSFARLKKLYGFGWKILVSNLINTIYVDLRQLIIGKRYSADDLAFYNRGVQFPKMLVENINSSIDSVLLPVMSGAQDKIERVKAMTRRSITTSAFILMPMMVGLGVCSTGIVRVLLTEKWLPCVFFLRVFCVTYALNPIATANLNAIKALGKSDYILILEIIKKSIGLIALFSTMWISPEAMALSMLATSVISQAINIWPNRKLMRYGFKEQIKDVLPFASLSAAMGTVCYGLSFLPIPNQIVILVIQIVTGVAIYTAGAAIFKFEIFYYLISVVKNLINKKENREARK